jgi:hypothetical protein
MKNKPHDGQQELAFILEFGVVKNISVLDILCRVVTFIFITGWTQQQYLSMCRIFQPS